MSVPNEHISDNLSVRNIAVSSNSTLQIKSMVSSLFVMFPAFLTDFSQTFDATWNTEEVFGRMDPIATYQGTKRTMSLGFDIPSQDHIEAKKNLIKTQKLVKMVYPVYSGNNLAKPPLVRVQFANLIKSDTGETLPNRQEQEISTEETGEVLQESNGQTSAPKFFGLLGWISGLSWKPSLEVGMFSRSGELYPKTISISFSFNVLHEKTLNQKSEKLNNWPFGVT